MALVTTCTCRSENTGGNRYDHVTRPPQGRAHRACHFLDRLVWRGRCFPGSRHRRAFQPGSRAGASCLSRDGFDHLVRHRPVRLRLARERGCLVTLSRWGLFRYYWVLLKLVITILATIVLLIHTQPIDLLAGVAAKTAVLGAHLQSQQLMVVASSVALVVLIVLTALSVYKPRGMTPYGQRKQDEQQKDITDVDATTNKAQGIVHELEDNGVHAATFK